MNPTLGQYPVAALDTDARAAFIARTYLHLFGAIVLFTGIETFFFASGLAIPMAEAMLSVSWLFVLGGFVVVSWFASRAARSATSPVAQYAALGGFVLAQAIIFVPLLVMAMVMTGDASLIRSAALTTLVGFAGLTAIVFVTRKDFSFLGGLLKWGFVVALVLIVAGAIFGFSLGVFFSVAMVALAGAAVLYDTSKILLHYPENMHVSAALELFASVALMFWYILQIFMSRR